MTEVRIKLTQRLVTFVSIILVLVVLGLIGYRFYDSSFDLFGSLSGVAALAVAYLTVAYVMTTSQQLEVMTQQLSEMKKSRELVDQPLPTIKIKTIHLEKPKFYYTPPVGRYSWQSLAQIKVHITNISEYPAVNVCIYPTIYAEDGEQQFSLTEDALFFEILGNDAVEKTFFITNDEKGELIEALINRSSPKLLIRILYKNILGSCFLSEHYFDLRFGSFKKIGMDEYKTKKEILKNWHERLASFENDFKNELAAIQKLTPHKSEEWRGYFDKIKCRFLDSLQGEKEFPIDAVVNSSKYNIMVVSSELYNQQVEAKRED